MYCRKRPGSWSAAAIDDRSVVRMARASAGEAMSVTVSCSHGRELASTPVVLGSGAMYSDIW